MIFCLVFYPLSHTTRGRIGCGTPCINFLWTRNFEVVKETPNYKVFKFANKLSTNSIMKILICLSSLLVSFHRRNNASNGFRWYQLQRPEFENQKAPRLSTNAWNDRQPEYERSRYGSWYV